MIIYFSEVEMKGEGKMLSFSLKKKKGGGLDTKIDQLNEYLLKVSFIFSPLISNWHMLRVHNPDFSVKSWYTHGNLSPKLQ